MAVEKSNDILMYMVLNSTDPAQALEGESPNEIDTKADKLAADFKPGRYFELEDFDISLTLDDTETGTATASSGRRFARWRAIPAQKFKALPTKDRYKSYPSEVRVVRIVDRASPAIAQACLKLTPFKKVVIVKRGQHKAGQRTGLLRFEFADCLIRSFNWDNQLNTSETVTFAFEKVTITYVKRGVDGSIDSEWPATWEAEKNG